MEAEEGERMNKASTKPHKKCPGCGCEAQPVQTYRLFYIQCESDQSCFRTNLCYSVEKAWKVWDKRA